LIIRSYLPFIVSLLLKPDIVNNNKRLMNSQTLGWSWFVKVPFIIARWMMAQQVSRIVEVAKKC